MLSSTTGCHHNRRNEDPALAGQASENPSEAAERRCRHGGGNERRDQDSLFWAAELRRAGQFPRPRITHRLTWKPEGQRREEKAAGQRRWPHPDAEPD